MSQNPTTETRVAPWLHCAPASRAHNMAATSRRHPRADRRGAQRHKRAFSNARPLHSREPSTFAFGPDCMICVANSTGPAAHRSHGHFALAMKKKSLGRSYVLVPEQAPVRNGRGRGHCNAPGFWGCGHDGGELGQSVCWFNAPPKLGLASAGLGRHCGGLHGLLRGGWGTRKLTGGLLMSFLLVGCFHYATRQPPRLLVEMLSRSRLAKARAGCRPSLTTAPE